MQINVPDESVDIIARNLHFAYCDELGWPNGQPTWDEMPDQSMRRLAGDTMARSLWRILARNAIHAQAEIAAAGAKALSTPNTKERN